MQAVIILVVLIAELAFGLIYALWLDRSRLGKFLARYLTWFSVVVGVGLTVMIAIPILGLETAGKVALAFVFSSVGVIVRGLQQNAETVRQAWRILRAVRDDDELE